ncbi:MAG: molybdopterin-dependent oxidoreductase [Methanoregula sp.]|jgi:anaerobic selenocysteine-containing dehydrogenase
MGIKPVYQPAICGICPYGCAVLAASSNGKILDVVADKNTAYGHLCPRGKAAPQIVHSNRRLTTPLIRNGPRGTAAFRQANWDEAISFIVDKLLDCKGKYGPHSLASYFGGGSLEDSLSDLGKKYFGYIGSANDLTCGSICNVSSKILAPLTTLGITSRNIRPDFINSDVIFVWGANPYTNSGKGCWDDLIKAQARGAKLIVIDPRGSETAQIADLWVPVLPGTDGALLLAMLKNLLEDDCYDKEFVKEYTLGFPELKDYLAARETGELLNICGIDVNQFHELMRHFRSSRAVSVTFYTGLEYHPSGVQCVRALYILWALGGKLDVSGGLLLAGGPFDTVAEYSFSADALPVGAAEYPLFAALTGKGQFIELPKAVIYQKPYAVKSLLLLGASPMLSYPAPELWKEVYKALAILVVIDRFMPEDGRFADVVLPSTTYYENCAYYYYTDDIRLRQRVIPPVGEARNDVYILQSIAEGLGFGDVLPKNDDELLQYAFANHPEQLKILKESTYGFTKEQGEPQLKKYASGKLRRDGQPGFPTASGKLEIASPLLKKYGYDPLPAYVHPYKEKSQEYPYYLATGARSLYRYNSFGPNIAELGIHDKQATLDISPQDAAKLNLEDGEMVKVTTASGELSLPVRFYPMRTGTVHIPVGGGSSFHSSGWKNSNANTLCDINARDEISGYVVCKSLQCNIEKIK